MCNMNGYAGRHRAAPKLLDLLKQQEGFGGGHFSGIATIHEGKIHSAKVVGDVAKLIAETDALNLPGNVGIAHSRSPGDPYQSWAHPFFSSDGHVAYCANGTMGIFEDKVDRNHWYQFLKDQGFTFGSAVPRKVGKYNAYSDGNCVHFSDVMCGLVAYNHVNNGKSLKDAMATMITESPSAIAALAISDKEPKSLAAVRLDAPLMWGYKHDDGMYISTSAIPLHSFDVPWIQPVPMCCAMQMSEDGVQFSPIDAWFTQKLLEPNTPWPQATHIMDQLISDNAAHSVGELAGKIKPLWTKDTIDQSTMLAYEYIRSLWLDKQIELIHSTAKGSGENLLAPTIRVKKIQS